MICHDPPGSIKEELNFDKFMDGILIDEIKKNGVQEEKIEEHRVKKMISENRDRACSKIKYGKK